MRDRDGRTPLHMACTYGFKEAVEWLVEEGKCNVGESCLYSTCTWNPSITDTFGEQCFGLYTEVAFVEMLFCIKHKLFILDLGAWPLYSNWPLFGGGGC